MRIIFILFLIIGCQDKEIDGIRSYKIDKLKKEVNQAIYDSTQGTDLLSWEVPIGWLPVTNTQFSKANYLVPTSSGSADVSVSYFEGNAGGITANVNRWRRQLELEELSKEQIELMGDIFSSKLGQYRIYKIINPKNNDFGFLCSVMPAKDKTIFIKLKTYPDLIDSLQEQFIEFSSSFNYNE